MNGLCGRILASIVRNAKIPWNFLLYLHVVLFTCPFLSFFSLGRLSPEGIRAVANHMISKGRAEWTDDTKASLRIYYKSPAEWSQIIYTHMAKLGYTGQIMTLHELHSGGPCVGTDFEGLESTTLLRAVEILELSNKASILRSGASTIDEYGVKFI